MTERDHDVVIAGAGIAGLTLAVALSRQGMSVAVLEAGDRPTLPAPGVSLPDWDRRVSALTPSSTALLKDLGVWQHLPSERVAPYDHMHVWDAAGTGEISFTAASLGVPKLGDIVENRVTVDALLRAVDACRDVDIHWGSAFERIDRTHDTVQVVTSTGSVLCGSLLVGADGARSAVRASQNFEVRQWSYGQHAIVATVQLSRCHDNTCYQAFLPTGPLALLPLADPVLCSIVWSVDDGAWESLMALDDGAFVSAMNRNLAGSGLDVTHVGERAVFPLRQSHAIEYAADRVVLVADAAHSIHPLAGQGINLGLADVRVLAGELVQAYRDDLDWGSARVLGRYQRQRKGDNLAMMAAMEGFKRGFGSRNPLVRLARNAGLRWVDRMTSLKHWFARQALM